MGVADPAVASPPGHGMARSTERQERETLPRDSARGDHRCRSEAQAGTPRHQGQGSWQGHLRVPAVRCGVSIACVAQEREGAPPEAGGRHVALSISRGGSLATAHLLCGLPALPLLSLHTPGEEQRSNERQEEDEQPGRLGGWVPVVEQAHEQEDQNPEDDVPGDSPFREIKDPAHRVPPFVGGEQEAIGPSRDLETITKVPRTWWCMHT